MIFVFFRLRSKTRHSQNFTFSFIPNEKANPHIGTNNKLEFVEEVKLEFVCDIANVKTVLKNLREVHPYEEPAIDIVPILDESVFN